MELIDKQFELLKLQYESSRTWTLSCLALMITSFIGYATLKQTEPSISNVLFKIMQIFLVGVILLYLNMSHKFRKLHDYLGWEGFQLWQKIKNLSERKKIFIAFSVGCLIGILLDQLIF